MTDCVDQVLLLQNSQAVFTRDGKTVNLLSLTEAARDAKALADLGYRLVGAVGTLPDGTVNAAAEYGCGPLIARAVRYFVAEQSGRKQLAEIVDLESLWTLEDPRS
jgi:hypothetical protein